MAQQRKLLIQTKRAVCLDQDAPLSMYRWQNHVTCLNHHADLGTVQSVPSALPILQEQVWQVAPLVQVPPIVPLAPALPRALLPVPALPVIFRGKCCQYKLACLPANLHQLLSG